MVMRPGTYQSNCNGGEIDPAARGNTGLKQYYSGLALAENIQPVPQGGFDLLPRTRFAYDLGPVDGEAKLHRFTVDRSDAYVVVVTAARSRVFKAGVLVGDVVQPWADADVPLVKSTQRRETGLFFHADYSPRRLLRGGSDGVWSANDVAWDVVPDVDYGGAYTNVDEVWTINISWGSGVAHASIGINVSVDGEETSLVTLQADHADTVVLLEAALLDLAGVYDGIVVSLVGSHSTSVSYRVVFSGTHNSGNNYTVSGSTINTLAAVQTWREVRGKTGGEPVMSVARGWPRCATWYQDRLLLGGFDAKPSSLGASRTGEYFDLNIDLAADSGGMLINLDADGGEEIHHLIQGQYLGIFTTGAEYHLADRALKRNTPPNIMRSSTNGSSTRVAPVIQENSILYVSREETVVYAATYDAVSTSFQSAPLSILASHLIEAIRAMDLQVSARATDAQRLLMPRDDGLMVVACLIRNQDVSPFVRWVTDGLVRDVCVDGANRAHLLVDRDVAGVTHRFLEIWEDGLLFDAAITRNFDTPTLVVDGLGIHEGATVWADCDGWIEGPFVVADASITLPHAASTVTVGRWSRPVVTTLPLVRDLGGRQTLKRPARVHTVQLDVIDTTSIAIGANGRAARDQPISRWGDAVDTPPAGRTGELVVTGLVGFSTDGQVTITQSRPGRLQVRDITVQARV